MANLKDLIVNGAARIIGKVYASEFVGNLKGKADNATSADSATKASQDGAGNPIAGTYATKAELSAKNVSISSSGTGDIITSITTTNNNVITANKTNTISTGIIAMDGAGLPSWNGSRVPASTMLLGKNGIGIGGIDTSNDGATIYMTNTGTEGNQLIIALGDDSAQKGSQDYIAFRYLDTGGQVTYQSKIPFLNGTLVVSGTDTNGSIYSTDVHGAVWNDLADSIPLGKGDIVEPGYCYCFNGEHYTKTFEYMQQSYIGIHSDTYGFRMGYEEGKEKLDVAVSGFVLAYVDKEYPVGTPLTCTKDGYLTEISKKDKIEYPEMVIAKYWKSEPNEEWGSDDKKVKVNGRKWVKIK